MLVTYKRSVCNMIDYVAVNALHELLLTNFRTRLRESNLYKAPDLVLSIKVCFSIAFINFRILYTW